jgi:predicted HAD superfamily Cof-like phosphohydrolase
MQEQLQALLEFHRTMGVYFAEKPTAHLPEDVAAVRLALLEEELQEYREALAAGDLVAVADALTDLLYVLLGTFISHGLQDVAEALFAEVHRSNMTKIGPDGRVIYREDGKVLKPPTYEPPDLQRVLRRHR